jgi:hypothetical protein
MRLGVGLGATALLAGLAFAATSAFDHPSAAAPTPRPSAATGGGGSGSGGAPPAAGARVDGDNYSLEMTAPPCTAGAECTATVRLTARGEYHINENYPYKFKAADAPGVEYLGKDAGGKGVFSKAAGDFKQDGEKVGVMTLRFKAASKGSVTVGGQYKMSVCSAQNCQLETKELSLAIAVK